MKRKRNEPNNVSNKILCLQNGSNVEVQLDDGKWHTGIIIQCQTRKYLVQVEQEQYWIESDLIRSSTIIDQKRHVSFEYRPGQFLRNETKSSTNKIVSDEKISSPPPPPPPPLPDSKKKQKKTPFVWKPSATSTIQTRRSSKSTGIIQEENHITESIPNNEKSSEILIFRPVIRFVESSTSPKRHCSTDDENNLYNTNASTDSRSSSTTSTENPFPLEQQIKIESKSTCFLETPPPSLSDIHLIQEFDSNIDKPNQQLKSKRKQNHPQRKFIEQEKPTKNLISDRGYLSDEYSEPNTANENLLNSTDLEKYSQYLDEIFQEKKYSINQTSFSQELFDYLNNNPLNYQKLEDYRLQFYHENNLRLKLISNILEKIFLLFYEHTFISIDIPDEIQTHIKLCLKQTKHVHTNEKKIISRTKIKRLQQKSKRTHDQLISNDQQQNLLSPSSPLTPTSTKLSDDLLSPNNQLNISEHISSLPKERDIYEIIHCLCHCQIDNGFMIQCETCLCWSHCECVGVTANCIPAYFKCSICSKAEAERASQWTFSSILDDETTSLYLTTSTNSDKVSLLLSYCKRLWNLREQMIELKLRSTPTLRSLQYALRSDDLNDLYKSVHIQSDVLMAKIEERTRNRNYYQTIAQTIDHLVDSVCSSLTTSSCLSIELSIEKPSKSCRFNDHMDLMITHLCDDEQTKQRRLTIQNRYEQLMSNIDNKIQMILFEHQNIQTQLAFEFGIIPMDLSDEYLSYDTYESALRTAIDRLKC